MNINRLRLKRGALYFALMSVIFIIQSVFDLNILGHRVDLIATVFISIAMLDNLTEAVIFAIFAGIFTDLNFFLYEGIHTGVFVVSSIIIYFITNNFFTKNLATNMMFVSITLVCTKLIIYPFYFFLVDNAEFLLYFRITSAEVFISTVLSFITYFFVSIIYKKYKSKLGD